MGYNYVVEHNGRRASSGYCTDLFKKFYEEFKEMDLIKDNIHIKFANAVEGGKK